MLDRRVHLVVNNIGGFLWFNSLLGFLQGRVDIQFVSFGCIIVYEDKLILEIYRPTMDRVRTVLIIWNIVLFTVGIACTFPIDSITSSYVLQVVDTILMFDGCLNWSIRAPPELGARYCRLLLCSVPMRRSDHTDYSWRSILLRRERSYSSATLVGLLAYPVGFLCNFCGFLVLV